MNEQLTNRDFLYCYSPRLYRHLKQCGIKYILKAKSIKDDKIFTLYYRSHELQKALESYEQ